MEDGTRVEAAQDIQQQAQKNLELNDELWEDQLLRSGERMGQFFKFSHLQGKLKATSRRFAKMALEIISNLPANPERTVCLRKLLEAKDCAVRAVLEQQTEEAPRAGAVR